MFMVFNKESSKLDGEIFFNEHAISLVNKTKFIGVWIDDQLKWNHHISAVESKIRRNMFLIIKNKHILSLKHKLLLYNALIQPYITYCSPIWGHANTRKIATLQKKIVRAIVRSKNQICHTNRIFVHLSLLKSTDLIKRETIKLIISVIINKFPTCLNNCLPIKSNFTNTRSSDRILLQLPKENYKHSQLQLSIAGPKIWNSIADRFSDLFEAGNEALFCFIKQMFMQDYQDIPPCTLKNCISCLPNYYFS